MSLYEIEPRFGCCDNLCYDGHSEYCYIPLKEEIEHLKKKLKQANLNFQKKCDKLGRKNKLHAKKHRTLGDIKRLLWRMDHE